MALFRVGESSAPRFVGIAVSANLFPDHEGELFHLNCTLRLSSTMTRLDLNRNARARRAQSWLATPLWAGKSSANATASTRGQRGEPARGEGAGNLGSPNSTFWRRFCPRSARAAPIDKSVSLVLPPPPLAQIRFIKVPQLRLGVAVLAVSELRSLPL